MDRKISSYGDSVINFLLINIGFYEFNFFIFFKEIWGFLRGKI